MGVGFEDDMMVLACPCTAGLDNFLRPKKGGLDYDHMWVARAKYLTGPIDTHDVAIHVDASTSTRRGPAFRFSGTKRVFSPFGSLHLSKTSSLATGAT